MASTRSQTKSGFQPSPIEPTPESTDVTSMPAAKQPKLVDREVLPASSDQTAAISTVVQADPASAKRTGKKKHKTSKGRNGKKRKAKSPSAADAKASRSSEQLSKICFDDVQDLIRSGYFDCQIWAASRVHAFDQGKKAAGKVMFVLLWDGKQLLPGQVYGSEAIKRIKPFLPGKSLADVHSVSISFKKGVDFVVSLPPNVKSELKRKRELFNKRTIRFMDPVSQWNITSNPDFKPPSPSIDVAFLDKVAQVEDKTHIVSVKVMGAPSTIGLADKHHPSLGKAVDEEGHVMHVTCFTHTEASVHPQLMYNVALSTYHEEPRLALGDTTMVGPAIKDFEPPSELVPVGRSNIELTSLAQLKKAKNKEGWLKALIMGMERSDAKYSGCRKCRRSIGFNTACKAHPREPVVDLPSVHVAFQNGDDSAHALAFGTTVWDVLDIPYSVDVVTLPDAELQAFARKACGKWLYIRFQPSAKGGIIQDARKEDEVIVAEDQLQEDDDRMDDDTDMDEDEDDYEEEEDDEEEEAEHDEATMNEDCDHA